MVYLLAVPHDDRRVTVSVWPNEAVLIAHVRTIAFMDSLHVECNPDIVITGRTLGTIVRESPFVSVEDALSVLRSPGLRDAFESEAQAIARQGLDVLLYRRFDEYDYTDVPFDVFEEYVRWGAFLDKSQWHVFTEPEQYDLS
jgi:hypothetical protein